MSLFNTRREKQHMERMEDNAAWANRIEHDRLEKQEAYHASMLQLREREIETENFKITLRGDEARDYAEWQHLRTMHKDLLHAIYIIQGLAKMIDTHIERWFTLDFTNLWQLQRVQVEELVHAEIKQIDNKLLPSTYGKEQE